MRRLRLFLILLLLGVGSAARAEVQIAFYSKDLASTFPHAFVRLTGTNEATGEQLDVNYGFTPMSVGPGILMGSVRGMIHSASPEYVARSDRHFSLALTPEQHRSVVAIVEKWRDAPQPSYRLNGRNCVDFVAEVAAALGLDAPVVPKLMKKPRTYLEMVAARNSALIASWPSRAAVASRPASAAPATAR